MSRTRVNPRLYALISCLFISLSLTGCTGNGNSQVASNEAGKPSMHIYKSPTCGCCGDWVDHVENNGFTTEITDTENMDAIKQKLGVRREFQSCHTAVIDDYVFEGHIPASIIQRFLQEKPSALGLAVPGMPIGSPGMEMGDRVDDFDVLIIRKDGSSAVYARIKGLDAGTYEIDYPGDSA